MIFFNVSPLSLLDHLESDFSPERRNVITAATHREPPSSGALNSTLMNTQSKTNIDAIYNARPLQLHGPPVCLYNPAFATFRSEMARPLDEDSFSHEELSNAFQFIDASTRFWKDEDQRIAKIRSSFTSAVHDDVLTEVTYSRERAGKEKEGSFKPDGSTNTTCDELPSKPRATTSFTEVKNSVGLGGKDPIDQAELDFRARVTHEDVCSLFLFCVASLADLDFYSIKKFVMLHAAQHF